MKITKLADATAELGLRLATFLPATGQIVRCSPVPPYEPLA